MKIRDAIILFSSVFFVCGMSFGASKGPILPHNDTANEREFQNLYQLIGSGGGGTTISSATINTSTVTATIGDAVINTSNITSMSATNATVNNSLIGIANVTNLYGATFGKVKQVVAGTSSTAYNTTSTTFVDTNLSATITPSVNTSSIVVVACGTLSSDSPASLTAMTLERGITELSGQAYGLVYSQIVSVGSVVTNTREPACAIKVDYPSTTSATTYHVQISNSTGGTSSFGKGVDLQVMILFEVGQ